MYRSLFRGDLLAEVERLQRELQQSCDTVSPSIRGFARGYPALDVGSTPKSVEIYAFELRIDPERIEINLERGVLIIEGERIIAELPFSCTAVATDIESGEEVWLREGRLSDAIPASMATPLVNQLPLALTLDDGTDLTIAVVLGAPTELRPEPPPARRAKRGAGVDADDA